MQSKTVRLSERTDRELVALAQRGNIEAFGILYEKNRTRIFALCVRMLENRTLAEDLMQEAFLTAFAKLGSFRGDSAFSTWLYQIAVNNVLMHLRKGRRDTSILFTDLTQDRTQDDHREQKELTTKDDRLHALADRVTLERAIEDLSPGYRLVLILHDIEGYEHNEIAEMLGCSLGNTKSQLHKARMRLRTKLLKKDSSTEAQGSRSRRPKMMPKKPVFAQPSQVAA